VLFRVAATAIPAGPPVASSPVAGATPAVAATPAAVAVGDLELFLDLSGSVVPFGEGFNLNGIVAGLDGNVLLVVHATTGGLYRIDLPSQGVTEVDLGGATLENGDGLALQGDTLYVVRNADGVIVPVQLSADLTSGTVGEGFADPAFAFPTTIAPYDGCLLVVNSQFDQQQGGQPQLPFTVVGIPIPAAAGAAATPTGGGC
jgi:hypothetical protein